VTKERTPGDVFKTKPSGRVLGITERELSVLPENRSESTLFQKRRDDYADADDDSGNAECHRKREAHF